MNTRWQLLVVLPIVVGAAASAQRQPGFPAGPTTALHPPHGLEDPPSLVCPGSRVRGNAGSTLVASRLRQWPIQLHLLPPTAPFLEGAELLLAADCVAYAVGGFHQQHLDGRALAIACPKLDSQQEAYVAKLAAMIDHGGILAIEVMVMEVPCCRGLVQLAHAAIARAARTVPVRVAVVGISGEVRTAAGP